MVARHIGRHLPGNPTVIAQNMDGAGSFRAASYMASQAPSDGTVIALIARDASLGPITGNPGAQFDPTKFSWLGTTPPKPMSASPTKTRGENGAGPDDHGIAVGDNGAGTGTGNYPKALNQFLGLKFKIIRGYVSSADVVLAMERGEVDGYCESLESVFGKRPDWIPRRPSTCCSRAASAGPEIKDVPFINDLAKRRMTGGHRVLYAGQGIGRPFFAPPGLRRTSSDDARGFDATMKDPEFVAEARQRKLTLAPENGEYMQRLIERIYATPRPIVERVGNLLK